MTPFDHDNGHDQQHDGGGGTTVAAESLSHWIRYEKKQYLEARKTRGGTAQGFREWISKRCATDPGVGEKFNLQGIIEAANRGWQAQPRKKGPDLFAVGIGALDFMIPEYLTRPVKYVTADDIEQQDGEAEDRFEKIDQRYATIADFDADTTIKLKNAARAGAAANRQVEVVDELIKRARGNLAMLLRDVVDTP